MSKFDKTRTEKIDFIIDKVDKQVVDSVDATLCIHWLKELKQDADMMEVLLNHFKFEQLCSTDDRQLFLTSKDDSEKKVVIELTKEENLKLRKHDTFKLEDL